MDNEQMKAKARELIENAPDGLLAQKANGGTSCAGLSCGACVFSTGKYECLSCDMRNRDKQWFNAAVDSELERRQIPEYKAQQALRAIPNTVLIVVVMEAQRGKRFCGTNLSGAGCDGCHLRVDNKCVYSKSPDTIHAFVKSEYARRFPNGHDKGEKMKIEIGKKYRLFKEYFACNFNVGDIVECVELRVELHPRFKRRDGVVQYVNPDYLAPIEDADEYPLQANEAVAKLYENIVIQHKKSGFKYRIHDGAFQYFNPENKMWCCVEVFCFQVNDRFRIVPSAPVETTELVGMFGNHKVEVKRVDGKLVRDKVFKDNLYAAEKVLMCHKRNNIVDESTERAIVLDYQPLRIKIGCQTVPFGEALELAQKFIKLAEGE